MVSLVPRDFTIRCAVNSTRSSPSDAAIAPPKTPPTHPKKKNSYKHTTVKPKKQRQVLIMGSPQFLLYATIKPSGNKGYKV
jgi:hypothetical protein